MEFFDLNSDNLFITSLSKDILYRVQYDGSETSYSPELGFTARDTQTFYSNWDDVYIDFSSAVEDHLCWRKRRPSLFISLFASRRHAEDWALAWSAHHGGRSCLIFEIRVSQLARQYVFHAEELRRTLHLFLRERPDDNVHDEYLVAHQVPPYAIVGCRGTWDVIRERRNQPEKAAACEDEFASIELINGLDALCI